MFKRFSAVLIAAMMLLLAAAPALAKTETPQAVHIGERRSVEARAAHENKDNGMTVRDAYFGGDYYTVLSFLESRDSDGVKHGYKINPDYDSDDPETWYSIEYNEEEDEYYVTKGFTLWAQSGGYWHLDWCNIKGMGFEGTLNLKDCEFLEFLDCSDNDLTSVKISNCQKLSQLDCSCNRITSIEGLSGCSELTYLDCSNCNITGPINFGAKFKLVYMDLSNNNLEELDVYSFFKALKYLFCDNNALRSLRFHNCPALMLVSAGGNELTDVSFSYTTAIRFLDLRDNALTHINLSSLASLQSLDLIGNELTEMDLSANTELEEVGLLDNPLTEIDLSNCPLIPRDMIKSEGNGTVGYLYYQEYNENGDVANVVELAAAYPGDGERFAGWYGEDGTPLYFDPEFDLSECGEAQLTARFGEPGSIPGDADGNGIVDTTDALIVLRAALGISGDAEALLDACDMDANGAIDTTDALLILRMALGIG